jgi:hypothetical protein
VVQRTRWFIVFPDRVWCNEDLLSRPNQEKDQQQVRDFLSQKTHKAFARVQFIEDVLGP